MHGPETDAAAQAILDGQYGHGPRANLFERELAAYLSVPDVVAVSSATMGIQLALLVCGIGPGDDVIVPSQTFAATIQPITALRARPRFVDHDPGTLCIEPAAVLEALTPDTRAVIPVLYGGRPVDVSSILDRLQERGITVIEDAAQAFGSRLRDVLVGADEDIVTVFSFGPIKQVTALVGATPRGRICASRCPQAPMVLRQGRETHQVNRASAGEVPRPGASDGAPVDHHGRW
ncbi:aminotransferase class I/II-fold pyridoxal phosphate-dependent enzyme [Streptomyces sp. NBC_01571]|uniref:DegT/DnrJ/EryC1/StrS family aminotransferase n=1 Tax=Streptomyces sp. NBC_01571 TaxID=2975883 RepID=UPI00225B5E8F|nr:aminotransferase class I/II-fold pyridoxal phosphate-dependent enzyme [Streptomyces sp. NBC_01571]MCX4580968.1 aminotransferase class I/II-fold pyridoxal phosphate-dependent enzyme [Streptomyces sp. NBC_01571]